MRIGIGLPATVPGVERDQFLTWARLAEERGFASLGTIDRLIYPNWEPLVALAAAAAVTERIDLVTSILIVPYRETALLAKQAATVDRLSGGRLVLGVGIGSRDDDYRVVDVEVDGRGARLERQLDEMRRIWHGEKLGHAGAVGPAPVRPDGPRLVVGGGVDASFERAARHGEGWIMGGGTPDRFADAAARVRAAWQAAGRDGEPRLMALGYYALGEDAAEHARSYIGDYYAWLGDQVVEQMAARVPTTPEAVRDTLTAFERAGCDELILFPSSSDPQQVDLLADACGLTPAQARAS